MTCLIQLLRHGATRLLLGLALWSLASQPLLCATGDDLLPALKAAYLYNFTHFIQWPEAPANRPFVIGVIADPAMEAQLRVLERAGKQVDDRPIQIRAYSAPETLSPSEILFVGAAASDRLPDIVARTAGMPTLLVGDTPGDAARGVAIELFLKPDIFRKTERLRFRINRSALRGRDLKISAQLYDVAEMLP